VVVPVYNGGQEVVDNVEVIRRAVTDGLRREEVEVVVSDGSIDGTAEGLLEARAETGIRVIHYDRNLGKGYAVKLGAMAGRGEWVALVDADLDLDARLSFFDFVRIERRSAFVVTDSRGSQEECFYLDRPCLLHRVRTERREGLGENAALSGMSADVLRDFLRDPGRLRRRSPLPAASPSAIIAEDLERRGF
jgi:glycosyltransferase involved in cell wall biosynthesis